MISRGHLDFCITFGHLFVFLSRSFNFIYIFIFEREKYEYMGMGLGPFIPHSLHIHSWASLWASWELGSRVLEVTCSWPRLTTL